MSKRSTATVRRQPVVEVTSASGNLHIHGETFTIQTDQRVQVIDLTDRVMALVRDRQMSEGLVSLYSMHTTCALFINEFQAALASDITTFLEQVVVRNAGWLHDNPSHSDCDRGNADAHLRALLLGHSLTLQMSGGEVVLGRWQRILIAELDGPQLRTLRLSTLGLG